MPLPPSDRPLRLLLVGGGHAMLPALEAAGAFRARGADVTLLNEHPRLYYSGMVPEHLGGVYTSEEVQVDLARMCAARGVRLVHGRAVALDRTARTVVADDGAVLPYDIAAFDVGARNPGSPGAAIETKPLHRIEAIERRVQTVLADADARLRLLIAGGGAAGVEIALNLAGRFERAGRRAALDLTLVEPGAHVLGGFPDGAAAHASSLLARRGVHVLTGQPVRTVHPDRVLLENGTDVRVDAALWATGSVGQSLFAASGLPCDDRAFVRVDATLRTVDDPRVFAAGDCAAVAGHERLPRIGVHAVKQGPTLRDNLARTLDALRTGGPADLAPWRPYPVAPLILSTGADEGIFVAPPLWLRGRPLLRLKHFVDQRWMAKYHPGWACVPAWSMLDARHAR